MSYSARLKVEEEVRSLRAVADQKNRLEKERRLSLSEFKCYCEGYARGVEDSKDEYYGAIGRSSLGSEWAYPDQYRQGYKDAFNRD